MFVDERMEEGRRRRRRRRKRVGDFE